MNDDLKTIAATIEKFDTREEAREYIIGLKLKKNELLNIGKIVNANVSPKDNKEKIVDWIINATIGNRLKCEAIAQIDLSRK